MKEKHSVKFLRQRKMMLVLPVLIIPFITMGFWALGGGEGQTTQGIVVVRYRRSIPEAREDAEWT